MPTTPHTQEMVLFKTTKKTIANNKIVATSFHTLNLKEV